MAFFPINPVDKASSARFVPGSVTAIDNGTQTVIMGAPAVNTAHTLVITDDPNNPRAGNLGNFIAVQDHNNAPIFGIPPAGGPKAFGDYMGCWTGTGSPSSTFTPWDGVQFVGAGSGVFTGPTIYAGVGAPLPASTITKLGTFTQVANVGDIYIRQDLTANPIYTCTVAGTGGARGGTWQQQYVPATGNANCQALFVNLGNVDVTLAGNGLRVAEGSNAKQGTATLAAGTVTVANTSVTANSRIFLTAQTSGAAPGALRVSTLTAGTSFVITSTSGTDTSVVAYEIFEPG